MRCCHGVWSGTECLVSHAVPTLFVAIVQSQGGGGGGAGTRRPPQEGGLGRLLCYVTV